MKFLNVMCVATYVSGANAFFAPNVFALSKPLLERRALSVQEKSHMDTSLHMSRSNQKEEDNGIATSTSLQTARTFVQVKDAGLMGVGDFLPVNVVAFGGFALLLYGIVAWFLQYYLNQELCVVNGGTMCSDGFRRFSEFFAQHPIASGGLILTHAIPFALIPWTMKIVEEKGQMIKKDHPTFDPFVTQLGLATICFGLALEFGWHVADSWYYVNNFHILNFGFYFFLISAFALWADGLPSENDKFWDIIFGAVLLVATVLYPTGNAAELGLDPPLPQLAPLVDAMAGDGGAAKIPLYAGLTVTFTAVSRRGWRIFGSKMGIVFFFCVVVNLAFIALLNQYADPAQVLAPVDPQELTTKNYWLHIAHDLLGTEAGVFYFTKLVSEYEPKEEY